VAAAWFLGLALFIATAGIGYIGWSVLVWGQGRTPAQRMLGLRCWLPLADRVAGPRDMAVRQISGVGLSALGVFVWLLGAPLRSMGDVLADTMVVYDPGRRGCHRVVRAAVRGGRGRRLGGSMGGRAARSAAGRVGGSHRLRWRAEFRRCDNLAG
jgi:hypothetical protein